MRKCLIVALALLLCVLMVSCAAEGLPQEYTTEHEHVYGFWYDAQSDDGVRRQVRYCKICHAEQVQEIPDADTSAQ